MQLTGSTELCLLCTSTATARSLMIPRRKTLLSPSHTLFYSAQMPLSSGRPSFATDSWKEGSSSLLSWSPSGRANIRPQGNSFRLFFSSVYMQYRSLVQSAISVSLCLQDFPNLICTVLYCTVLYCTVYCTILYCTCHTSSVLITRQLLTLLHLLNLSTPHLRVVFLLLCLSASSFPPTWTQSVTCAEELCTRVCWTLSLDFTPLTWTRQG